MKSLTTLKEEIDENSHDPKLQIDLLEQSIQLAEEMKLRKRVFQLRTELIEIANFSGYALKGIVAFGHNLKYADEYPDKIDIDDFLWTYRFVIESSTSFYQVELKQIEEMTQDLKERLLANAYDLTPYYDLRYKIAYKMNHMEDLKKYYKLKTEYPEDGCDICNLGMTVDFIGATEGYDAAEIAAKDIFSGKKKCDSVPEVPFCNLLSTALYEGKYEKAEMIRKRVHPIIDGDEDSVGSFGDHIVLFLIQKKPEEALKLFKKYYKYSLNPTNTGRNFFEFTLGAYLLFEILAKQNQEVVLPFEIKEIAERMVATDPKNIADHFKKQVYTIAINFDQRNGNQMYHTDINTFEKALFG